MTTPKEAVPTRESTAEQILRHAQECQPELWERTEAVARIIDPGAFEGGWVVSDESARKLLQAKLDYQKAVAMLKAQEVLKYLGVNTDTDWLEILTALAEEGNG